MTAHSKLPISALATCGKRVVRLSLSPIKMHAVNVNMVSPMWLIAISRNADTSLGAPECYEFKSMEPSTVHFEPEVDIWSLGCIFSEAAAWVVHGREGLEAYRKMRHDETQISRNFENGRAFHDGEAVLRSVNMMHQKVRQNLRISDHITGHAVETVITKMLDELDCRLSVKQVWSKSQNILKEAEEKLKPIERVPIKRSAVRQRLAPRLNTIYAHAREHTPLQSQAYNLFETRRGQARSY